MSKVIGTYWFAAQEGFFGVVKVKAAEGTRFYIGPAKGDDEKKDANHIHVYGSPIEPRALINFLTDDRVKEFQEDDKDEEEQISSKKRDYIYAGICFATAIGLLIAYAAQIQL